MNCRHCANPLTHQIIDLGYAPPSNAYLTSEQLHAPEVNFPLRVMICEKCWLAQTEDFTAADEVFSEEYAYFSSTSTSWLKHAASYSAMVQEKLALNEQSFVVEIAANDGYLLRNFVEAKIPCLGIEPTDSTACAAEKIGVPIWRRFFGEDTARLLVEKRQKADLICGNNVYAHVPDINDFTKGLAIALKDGGTITLEFPNLMSLMKDFQFDTIYHEHFSYLSLTSARRIFASCGLRIFDVERLPTHGGSYRIYGCHNGDERADQPIIAELLEEEEAFGLLRIDFYSQFKGQVEKIKDDLLLFLLEQKRLGKRVAAYGAAAKGNTFMNYAGIRGDLIAFVADAAPSKQGKWMPGNHLPILPPAEILSYKPDYVVIFPWNIAQEVIEQQQAVLDYGGRFVIAIPSLQILEQ
jgi:SAM-dependent methyltransferase